MGAQTQSWSRDRHQQRESQERQVWDGRKVVRGYSWSVHGVGEGAKGGLTYVSYMWERF